MSSVKICKRCEHEFENRTSDFCSPECAAEFY